MPTTSLNVKVRRETLTPALVAELRSRHFFPTVDGFDVAIIARLDGRIVGCQFLRPCFYIHSLELAPSPIARKVADALFVYTEGYTGHSRDFAPPGSFAPAGTLFQCRRDNATIQRYMEGRGACVEPDTLLYRYDIP